MRDLKVDAYLNMVAGWSIRQAARQDVADACNGSNAQRTSNTNSP